MVGTHGNYNYVCVALYNVKCLHVYLILKHMAYMMVECVEISKSTVLRLLV